jgi:hypothetical protein
MSLLQSIARLKAIDQSPRRVKIAINLHKLSIVKPVPSNTTGAVENGVGNLIEGIPGGVPRQFANYCEDSTHLYSNDELRMP